MRMEIPENRTKEYWDKKMPDVYKNSNLRLLGWYLTWKSLIFIILVVATLYHYSPFVLVFLFLEGICYSVWVAVDLDLYLKPLRKIKKNGGENPEEQIEAIFENVAGTWRTYGLGENNPEVHPVNKLFPEDIIVFQFVIAYKLPGQRFSFFFDGNLYCIGTPEKRELIEKLIHMKEGVALRHESRRFKVTYKKYSKELVRIDLCEDEEYPAHCHYEELVERINLMF